MPRTISGLSARDIRTPTSRTLAGSDAVHTDPDYSATYVVLTTDARDGLEGHGITFTLGRGNEVVVAAVRALQHLVVGETLESLTGNLGAFWQRLTNESQLRWIGPEKGALHLATAAIVNAVWDLYAKVERKPVWKLVTDMTPEQFVDCIDFRYITDAITRDEALAILRGKFATRAEREAEMRKDGYPAYITSAGWMGYPLYQQEKKEREAKKHQKVIVVKEVKFRINVDDHDYETKKNHILRFLDEGDKVKVTIFFRGREMTRTSLGREILERLIKEVGEHAIVEFRPRQEGNTLHAILAPGKKAQAAG